MAFFDAQDPLQPLSIVSHQLNIAVWEVPIMLSSMQAHHTITMMLYLHIHSLILEIEEERSKRPLTISPNSS